MISVIVPIRGESAAMAEPLRALANYPGVEMLVADAGDDPAATAAFREIGARIIPASGSRGARLQRAAMEAAGEVLLFLHADSRPPDDAVDLIRSSLADGSGSGAFSLAYEKAGLGMRWIAAWANLRSRWFRLPFGDQGIFCTRDVYERSGGFRDLPVCDDLDFVRRLARVSRLRILPQKTRTSPRRYRDQGALRQLLRNWRVQAGYFAGVDPGTLDRWYNGK